MFTNLAVRGLAAIVEPIEVLNSKPRVWLSKQPNHDRLVCGLAVCMLGRASGYSSHKHGNSWGG